MTTFTNFIFKESVLFGNKEEQKFVIAHTKLHDKVQ